MKSKSPFLLLFLLLVLSFQQVYSANVTKVYLDIYFQHNYCSDTDWQFCYWNGSSWTCSNVWFFSGSSSCNYSSSPARLDVLCNDPAVVDIPGCPFTAADFETEKTWILYHEDTAPGDEGVFYMADIIMYNEEGGYVVATEAPRNYLDCGETYSIWCSDNAGDGPHEARWIGISFYKTNVLPARTKDSSWVSNDENNADNHPWWTSGWGYQAGSNTCDDICRSNDWRSQNQQGLNDGTFSYDGDVESEVQWQADFKEQGSCTSGDEDLRAYAWTKGGDGFTGNSLDLDYYLSGTGLDYSKIYDAWLSLDYRFYPENWDDNRDYAALYLYLHADDNGDNNACSDNMYKLTSGQAGIPFCNVGSETPPEGSGYIHRFDPESTAGGDCTGSGNPATTVTKQDVWVNRFSDGTYLKDFLKNYATTTHRFCPEIKLSFREYGKCNNSEDFDFYVDDVRLYVKVDWVEPTTSISPNGTNPVIGSGNWVNYDVNFTLSRSDTRPDGSPGAFGNTYYKVINDGDACGSTGYSTGTSGTVTCPAGSVCKKRVCYYSVDDVGNQEATKISNVFYIDKQSPTTSITSPADNSWQKASFNVNITDSTEAESGIFGTYYQVLSYDGTYWRATTQNNYFYDDFADGDYTTPQWTVNAANDPQSWSVSAGALRQSNTSNGNTNIYTSLNQSGATLFEWKVTYNSGAGRAGIHIFSSDATQTNRGTTYLLWHDDVGLKIYKWVNNTYQWGQTLYSSPVIVPSTHTYRVQYDPASGKFMFWLDGVYRGSYTDSSPITTGSYLSLRTNATDASFDDIKVYKERTPSSSVTVTVGSAASNDCRYQSPDSSTPSCKVESVIADNAGNVSTSTKSYKIDWTAPGTPSITVSHDESGYGVVVDWAQVTDTGGSGLLQPPSDAYEVQRASGGCGGSFSTVATVETDDAPSGKTAPAWYNSALTEGATYGYRVRAGDVAGNWSSYSTCVAVTIGDMTPPGTPTGLTATTVSTSRIDLSWTAPGGSPSKYNIYSAQNSADLGLLSSFSDVSAFADGEGGVGCTGNLKTDLATDNDCYLYASPGTVIGYTWTTARKIGTVRLRYLDGDNRIYYDTVIQTSTDGSTWTTQAVKANFSHRAYQEYDLGPLGLTVKGVRILFNAGNTTDSGKHLKWMDASVSWLASDTASPYSHTGLTANTQYHYKIDACDATGNCSAPTAVVSRWTYAAVANVNSARTANQKYTTGTFDFTNAAGWGGGGVQYYRYAWNSQKSYVFSGTESTWSDADAKCPGGSCTVAGLTLSLNGSCGANYLHVKAYNGEDVSDVASNSERTYGPYFWEGAGCPTTAWVYPAFGTAPTTQFTKGGSIRSVGGGRDHLLRGTGYRSLCDQCEHGCFEVAVQHNGTYR